MSKNIIDFINKNGGHLITNVQSVHPRTISGEMFSDVYKGEVCICGQMATLLIGVPSQFPSKLPEIYLMDPNAYGFIPHVMKNGKICFVQEEGLMLDTRYPNNIVIESIELALSTLKKGIRGENRNDFIEEFESYWIQQPDILVNCHSIVDLNDQIKEVSVWLRSDTIVIADNKKQATDYLEVVFKTGITECVSIHGIYIPLDSANQIFPPEYSENWTVKDINQIIDDHLSSEKRCEMLRLLKKFDPIKTPWGCVIISIPHKDRKTLIGFRFSLYEQLKRLPKQKRKFWFHPLRKISQTTMWPLYIQQHQPRHTLRRGGGMLTLQNKHVLIAGVGSVGSRIALELVRAGVGQLTLIDPDKISIDNVYRHELGANRIYKSVEKGNESNIEVLDKAVALHEEIKQKFPAVNVYSIPESIETVIEEEYISFTNIDLIVVATGNPVNSQYINRIIRDIPDAPPVIYTWLEPLGIGGHALLSHKDEKGCYQCLFRQDEETGNLKNIASFVEPGQNITEKLSGCADTFTPFGSLDAVQTAILATRLSIDSLTNRETGNPLYSWKGNADEFLLRGYKLSTRYQKSTYEDLQIYRYHYINSDCPVCNQSKGSTTT